MQVCYGLFFAIAVKFSQDVVRTHTTHTVELLFSVTDITYMLSSRILSL